MTRKLVVVAPRDQRMYIALRGALPDEFDIEVVCDRRDRSQAGRWRDVERRILSDVDERIRRDGFAVIRPRPAPVVKPPSGREDRRLG